MRGRGAATMVGASIRDVFHVYMLYPVVLEMVRIRVTFLLHNVAISGSCMFHILTGPRVRTLLFHMSVSIGTRIVLRLGHVSLLHWTKCHIFIGPSGMTTIPRVSFLYSTTCLDAVCPRVGILLGHMSRPELPTSLFLIQPRGRTD